MTAKNGDLLMARSVQQLFDLSGKTALVTGGSRGLGLQMAQALGEAGARIMLSSRKAEDLEQAVAELQAAGIDARWIAADCAREADIRRLRRAARCPPHGSPDHGVCGNHPARAGR